MILIFSNKQDAGQSEYGSDNFTNHVHLLLRTGNVPISNVMHRLLTGYAVQFNRRSRRHGHVFQNRYKSILCQEDVYLKELVRYIHLNPLRAKLVANYQSLKKFGYSGHCSLMGKSNIEWQDTKYVLALFGKKMSEARRSYAKFLNPRLVSLQKGERR